MTTTTTHTKPRTTPAGDAAEHPSKVLLDGLAQAELSWLKPVSGAGAAMIDSWADIFEESAGFVARRIRQDVRTLHAVLHCRTPSELRRIQAEFVQNAVDEYQVQSGRIMGLMENASRSLTQPKSGAS